jgi:AcrR family transcriptional regulator
MARTPDLERRQELLDRIVEYLAEHGLAQATLRPMAAALGVSINRLVHHFGPKDDLLTTALARAIELQVAVREAWLRDEPELTQVEQFVRWWEWMNDDPRHLALVRLNYEAAALDTSVTGLAGEVRAQQIGVWRHFVEEALVHEGAGGSTEEEVAAEASIIKATFTGLVMDLLATGDRERLDVALRRWLEGLSPPRSAATAGARRS